MSEERFGFGAVFTVNVHQAVTNMGRADRARAQLEHGFMKMSIGLSQMTSGFQRVAQGLISGIQQVGMAITAITAVSGREFLKFEDSIAELGSVLDKGQAAAQRMRGGIEKVAISAGIAGTEVAQATALARGSGIAGAEAMRFVQEAAKGAVASYASLTSIVDAGTSIINAYGDSLFVAGDAAKKMAAINDVLRISALEGKQTVEEMAQFIGLGASEASMAGVDFREFAAAYATLSLAGQGASRSVVNLNQLIRQFTHPAEKAAKLAAAHGIALNRAYIQQHGGVVGALRAVNKAVGGNVDLLQKIIGSEVRASRAVSGLMSGYNNFLRIQERVLGGVGSTDRAFKDMSQTVNFQVRQAVVGLRLGFARVGRAFFSVFGEVGINTLKWFGRNLDIIERKAQAFFQRMKHGFELLGVGNLGKTLRRTFDVMTAFFGRFTGGKKSAEDMAIAMAGLSVALAPLMMLITPFVGVLGGLITMIASLVPLVTGFASIVGFFSGKFAALAIAVGDAGGVVALFSAVFAPLLPVLALVTGAIGAIIDNTNGFRTALGDLLGVLWDVLKGLASPILNAAGLVFEVLKYLVGSIGGAVLPAISGALNAIWAIVEGVVRTLDHFIDALRAIFHWLQDKLKPSLDQTTQQFRDLGHAFDVVGDTLRGLYDGSIDVLELIGVTTESSVERVIGATMRARSEIERIQALLNSPYKDAKFSDITGPLGKAYDKGMKWWDKNKDSVLDIVKHTEVVWPTPGLFPLLAMRVDLNTELKNKVCVDGRDLSVALSTAQATLTERGGGHPAPWQTHQVRTYGGHSPQTA